MRLLSFFTVLVFIAAGPLMAADPPQLGDSVTKKLQGRWEIVGGVNQGQQLTVPAITGTYVTVELNTITTYDANEQQRFQAVFQIDESKKPVQITMTDVPPDAVRESREPEQQQSVRNVTASGILKFEGDNKWTLCYGLPGVDRPKKFASPPDSKIMLFKLQRDKATAEVVDPPKPGNIK